MFNKWLSTTNFPRKMLLAAIYCLTIVWFVSATYTPNGHGHSNLAGYLETATTFDSLFKYKASEQWEDEDEDAKSWVVLALFLMPWIASLNSIYPQISPNHKKYFQPRVRAPPLLFSY